MKGLKKRCASSARSLCCIGLPLVIAWLSSPSSASAAVYSLSSQNSTAVLDAGTSAGLKAWTVDGVNQLSQQWFWFGIDGSVPPRSDLTAITTTPYVTTLGSSILTALYTNSQYGVQLNYTLQGQAAGSGRSSLNETVRAYNFTSATQSFRLFMYTGLILGGQTGNQSVHIVGNDGFGDSYSIQTLGSPVVGSNNLATSTAVSFYEAGTPATTLADTINAAHLNDTATAGPGSVAWAYEWDLTLAPGTSTGISMINPLQVPELSTSAFITLGFGAWLLRFRRRYQKTN
jgi:hypothetical protein